MKTCNAPKTAFDYLCRFGYASAGPNGNLTGMRKLYWGKYVLVVRCCRLCLTDMHGVNRDEENASKGALR